MHRRRWRLLSVVPECITLRNGHDLRLLPRHLCQSSLHQAQSQRMCAEYVWLSYLDLPLGLVARPRLFIPHCFDSRGTSSCWVSLIQALLAADWLLTWNCLVMNSTRQECVQTSCILIWWLANVTSLLSSCLVNLFNKLTLYSLAMTEQLYSSESVLQISERSVHLEKNLASVHLLPLLSYKPK